MGTSFTTINRSSTNNIDDGKNGETVSSRDSALATEAAKVSLAAMEVAQASLGGSGGKNCQQLRQRRDGGGRGEGLDW